MKSNSIIDSFVDNPSIHNMNRLINYAKQAITNDEIAALAQKLASSGDILKFTNDVVTADIPSTGGIGSLSTLLCPLVLKQLGFIVPKIGIVGRPAGGIDILSQITNYKIDFSINEIYECLSRSNYCHYLVGTNFAPLDATLFSYRSKVDGAKAVPALVIASILAKKIAGGLSLVGLDVRVSEHGNFGTNWSEALVNSKKFNEVASILNIKTYCFLNNSENLQQPFIGRGEALLALYEIFENDATSSLKDHLFKCIDMAIKLKPNIYSTATFPINTLKANFEENIVAQGSATRRFYDKIEEVKEGHCNQLKSVRKGFLKVHIGMLRDLLVKYQKLSEAGTNTFLDPCGVIFKKMHKEFIDKGETILTYRIDKKYEKHFSEELSKTVQISESYQQDSNYKIIEL